MMPLSRSRSSNTKWMKLSRRPYYPSKVIHSDRPCYHFRFRSVHWTVPYPRAGAAAALALISVYERTDAYVLGTKVSHLLSNIVPYSRLGQLV